MAKRYFSPLSNIDFNTYGGKFKKGVVNGGVQQTTKGSTFSIYADDVILSTDYTGSYDSLSPGNINLIPTGAVFIGNSVNHLQTLLLMAVIFTSAITPRSFRLLGHQQGFKVVKL
jgi:hypothetical protein